MKVKFHFNGHPIVIDSDKVVSVFVTGQDDMRGKVAINFGGSFTSVVDGNLDMVLHAIGWELPDEVT